MEDLSSEFGILSELANKQAYVERLERLASELWSGARNIRDSLDEMESAIVGTGLKSLLDQSVGEEQQLAYANEKNNNKG